jgi:hypothetical protein
LYLIPLTLSLSPEGRGNDFNNHRIPGWHFTMDQKKRRLEYGRRFHFFYLGVNRLKPAAYQPSAKPGSYLAGRRTVAEAAQAIQPRFFNTFDEFFVTFIHTMLAVFFVILVSHGVYLHIFSLPVSGLGYVVCSTDVDRFTGYQNVNY